MSWFYRLLLSLSCRRNHLQILNYHQVLAAPDPLRPSEVTEDQFDQQMQWLASYFHPLPLDEALALQRRGSLPARAVAVTFDDGYENNVSRALPILKRRRVPATFFIASDFLDGGIMWNDRVIETVRQWPGERLEAPWLELAPLAITTDRQRFTACQALLEALKYLPPGERREAVDRLSEGVALPALMMSRAQLRQLADEGMTIGGHTCSHPILTRVSPEEAAAELAENRRCLASLLGAAPTLFAYPNGRPGLDFDGVTLALLAGSGYEYAVSTGHGIAHPDDDVFQIPRYTPWRKSRWGFLGQLAANYRRRAPQLPRAAATTPSNTADAA